MRGKKLNYRKEPEQLEQKSVVRKIRHLLLVRKYLIAQLLVSYMTSALVQLVFSKFSA